MKILLSFLLSFFVVCSVGNCYTPQKGDLLLQICPTTHNGNKYNSPYFDTYVFYEDQVETIEEKMWSARAIQHVWGDSYKGVNLISGPIADEDYFVYHVEVVTQTSRAMPPEWIFDIVDYAAYRFYPWIDIDEMCYVHDMLISRPSFYYIPWNEYQYLWHYSFIGQWMQGDGQSNAEYQDFTHPYNFCHERKWDCWSATQWGIIWGWRQAADPATRASIDEIFTNNCNIRCQDVMPGPWFIRYLEHIGCIYRVR